MIKTVAREQTSKLFHSQRQLTKSNRFTWSLSSECVENCQCINLMKKIGIYGSCLVIWNNISGTLKTRLQLGGRETFPLKTP